MDMWLLLLVASIVFLILEMFTPTLFFINLAVAAAISAIFAYLGFSYPVVTFVFLIVSIVATVVIYIPGLFWLGYSRHLTLAQTLAGGLTPFIVGDVLKMIVSSLVAFKLREYVGKLLSENEEE